MEKGGLLDDTIVTTKVHSSSEPRVRVIQAVIHQTKVQLSFDLAGVIQKYDG